MKRLISIINLYLFFLILALFVPIFIWRLFDYIYKLMCSLYHFLNSLGYPELVSGFSSLFVSLVLMAFIVFIFCECWDLYDSYMLKRKKKFQTTNS